MNIRFLDVHPETETDAANIRSTNKADRDTSGGEAENLTSDQYGSSAIQPPRSISEMSTHKQSPEIMPKEPFLITTKSGSTDHAENRTKASIKSTLASKSSKPQAEWIMLPSTSFEHEKPMAGLTPGLHRAAIVANVGAVNGKTTEQQRTGTICITN